MRLCPTCEKEIAEPHCSDCTSATLPLLIDGRYRLLGVVGRGGMGVVLRAKQVSAERDVAIKLLETTDGAHVQRFHREVQVTSRLEHPHAIRVYDNGTSEGHPYLVMELLRGHDLEQEIRTKGPIPLERAVPIALQALKALHAAHIQGIVHRDIKPANIYLHQGQDGQEVVKVMDFGIAALLEPDERKLTVEGQLFGTPAYMSPEQLRGDTVDGRADVYAVGLVFHEMLTGVSHFAKDTPMKAAMRQLNESLPSLPAARPDLAHRKDVEAAILAMTAKDVQGRPATAQEAAQKLMSLLPSGATASLPAFPSAQGVARESHVATIAMMRPPLGAAPLPSNPGAPPVSSPPSPGGPGAPASAGGPPQKPPTKTGRGTQLILGVLAAAVVGAGAGVVVLLQGEDPEVAYPEVDGGPAAAALEGIPGAVLAVALDATAGVIPDAAALGAPDAAAVAALAAVDGAVVDADGGMAGVLAAAANLDGGPATLADAGETRPPAGNAAAAAAVLLVKSVPPGASVFVDGEKKGETPLAIPRAEKPVKIRLEKASYVPAEKEIPPERTEPLVFLLQLDIGGANKGALKKK
jgi:serine/threonine-protein kinase